MWANLSSLTGSYVLNQKVDLQVVTPALEVEDWTNNKEENLGLKKPNWTGMVRMIKHRITRF